MRTRAFAERILSSADDEDHIIPSEMWYSTGYKTESTFDRTNCYEQMEPCARWTLCYTKSKHMVYDRGTIVSVKFLLHTDVTCCGMQDPYPVVIHEAHLRKHRFCRRCFGKPGKIYGRKGDTPLFPPQGCWLSQKQTEIRQRKMWNDHFYDALTVPQTLDIGNRRRSDVA